ncbi:MAG: DUF2285 domain-containing protein [Pseudomonadota bacterium]
MSPTTIILEPAPADLVHPTLIELDELGTVLADYEATDGRHLIIAVPGGKLRLWVRTQHSCTQFTVVIPADSHFTTRATAVARFAAILTGTVRKAQPPPCLPSAFQRHRLSLLLALLDAEQSGATRREMATHLLYRNSAPLAGALWTGSSQRRRVHRMVRQARHLAQAQYRDLLIGI